MDQREFARLGGLSRSESKRKAGAENLKKARSAKVAAKQAKQLPLSSDQKPE